MAEQKQCYFEADIPKCRVPFFSIFSEASSSSSQPAGPDSVPDPSQCLHGGKVLRQVEERYAKCSYRVHQNWQDWKQSCDRQAALQEVLFSRWSSS